MNRGGDRADEGSNDVGPKRLPEKGLRLARRGKRSQEQDELRLYSIAFKLSLTVRSTRVGSRRVSGDVCISPLALG